MKRERRHPTRAEWERITSRRPVVRRIPASKKEEPEADTSGKSYYYHQRKVIEPEAGELLEAELENPAEIPA